jgi:hypothetical protein
VTVRKDKGTEISATHTEEIKSVNAYAFSSVGAANGAVVKVCGVPLELRGLRVDAGAQPGFLENVTLAENGVLDVFNLESGRDAVDLPLNVASLAGKENIKGYSVVINGRRANWSCQVNADGTVRISPSGTYIIMR